MVKKFFLSFFMLTLLAAPVLSSSAYACCEGTQGTD